MLLKIAVPYGFLELLNTIEKVQWIDKLSLGKPQTLKSEHKSKPSKSLPSINTQGILELNGKGEGELKR